MEEIWKDILETEGKYQISNFGRVRTKDSFVKNGHGLRFVEGCVRKNTIRKGGYVINSFYLSGKRKSDYIHRLVWRYFGDGNEPNHKLTIDHIDNDKTNNRIDNLRIISTRENTTKGMLLKKKTSKYTGVYFRKDRNAWQSHIYINGERIFVGYFKKEYDAHKAYQKALSELDK